MDHEKLIAARMEEARELRGISYAELGRRASVEHKRLWYILNGQRQMRADEFIRLCMVLNLDMYQFLTREMKEDLQSRKSKMIEDFGSGLGGIDRRPSMFK